MPSKITPFYPVYDDLDGSPLANGLIYIGTAGTNPQVLANQISVYWDEALTIPAEQPIKTINGYPSRSGSPAAFYASAAEYSLTVLNKNGSLVYSQLDAFDDSTRLRNDLADSSLVKGSSLVSNVTQIVSSKAVAKTISPSATRNLYIRNTAGFKDGGEFKAVTGATPDTYSDDDAVFCGDTIIPIGGDGSAAWIRVKENVDDYYIQAHGAIVNGISDDTDAVKTTINTAGANGGGRIIIGGGNTCLCNSVSSGGGIDWVLEIEHDNIEIFVAAGTTLKSTANARFFHINGAGKPAGMANWASYNYNNAVSYGFNNCAKSASSIFTTTASDAGNFIPGDDIVIFTGQLLSTGVGNEADCEINEVISSDDTTGEIVLRWPTGKPYAQEHYVSGSSGLSEVGGAGTAAPMGVCVVTDRIIKNISFAGKGKIENTEAYNLLIGGQVVGFKVEKMELFSGANAFSMGIYRNAFIDSNIIHLTHPSAQSYWFTTAFGCSDITFSNNNCSAVFGGYFHAHEGSAKVRSINNTYSNPDGNSLLFPAMDIRARAYDFKTLNDSIFGGDNTNQFYADSSCTGGGEIDNLLVDSPSSLRAVRVEAASGWRVGTVKSSLGVFCEVGNQVDGGRLFLAPSDFLAFVGTPVIGSVGGGRWPAFLLDSTTTETVAAIIKAPKDWKEFQVIIHSANAGVGSGDVSWQIELNAKEFSESLNAASTSAESATITTSAQDILNYDTLSTKHPVTGLDSVSIRLSRIGASASDTLGNDIALLGIELVRVL